MGLHGMRSTGKVSVSATRFLDRISDPIFGFYPATLFSPAEGLQACERFPHIGFQG